MKKQTIIPILAITAVIVGIVSILPAESDGNVTRISSSVAEWTEQETIERSPYIVKGEIADSKTVKQYKGEIPIVFTIWDVKVIESLKGDIAQGSTIQVKTLGGQFGADTTISANHADYHEADELIMFLDIETDPKSFQGTGSYHLVTANYGVYEITNGLAIHENPTKNTSEDSLKEKIKKFK